MIESVINKLNEALEKCYYAGDVDDVVADIEEAIQMLQCMEGD